MSTIVIVGGGIAGTSCIEALINNFDEDKKHYRIVLISNGRLVKRAINYTKTGRHLESFDVVEDDVDQLIGSIPNGLEFKLVEGFVKCIDAKEKRLLYHSTENASKEEQSLSYDILCLCTGSKPRFINYCDKDARIDDRIIVLRDTSTVTKLQEKLKNCRRLVIVGNGGISLELVSKIGNCDKTWIIRDQSVGQTFFDSGAAKFLLDHWKSNAGVPRNDERKEVYNCASKSIDTEGPSLGPNWDRNFNLQGDSPSSQLNVIYQDEVESIKYNEKGEYPIVVKTLNSKQVFECDLVASAIGVEPNILPVIGDYFELSENDGGILVDSQMRTSASSIYAAGDVISCDKWKSTDLWFQMRLWTQARQMGYYAGQSIITHLNREDPAIYFNFECFTHSTSFFGHKVILLGKYNGQDVGNQKFEVIARVNPARDYVKVLVSDAGRIIGAVLVGESGLEETIENLMLDKIDISAFKDHLLDETVDIEDFFD